MSEKFRSAGDLETAILCFAIYQEGHCLENVTTSMVARAFGVTRREVIAAVTSLRTQGLVLPGNLAVRVQWENVDHVHICGAAGVSPTDAYVFMTLLDMWDAVRVPACTCADCVVIETDIPGFET